MAETDSTSVPVGQIAAPGGSVLRLTWLDAMLIFLMVIWGANFVVIKSSEEVLPIFVFNSLRFSLGTVALGIIFKLRGAKLILPRREWLGLIIVALLNVLYQLFFGYALTATTVANTALIVTTVPVWVVLFNAIRLHERLSRTAVLGVFLALGGVGVVVIGRYAGQIAVDSRTLIGDGMAFIASWVWVASLLASRRPLQRNPTMPATFWLMAWGAISQTVLAAPDLIRLDWAVLRPTLLLAICYSGIMSIGLGMMIWNTGVKTLGTSRAAVYTYLEPVVASVTAIIFLGEPFSIWLVVGSSLVILGLILVKKA